MYLDLGKIYWWNGMKRDIEDFVSKCPNFQQVNVKNQKSSGMTQEIDITICKCEVFNINFITGLSRIRIKHDSIQVIVDRMTKTSRFLVVKNTDLAKDYAKI